MGAALPRLLAWQVSSLQVLIAVVLQLLTLVGHAADPKVYWQVSCGDRFNNRSGVLDIELRWLPQPLPAGLLPDDRRTLRVHQGGIDLPSIDQRIAWAAIGALEVRPANEQTDAQLLTLVLVDPTGEERITVGVLELVCWRDVETLTQRYSTKTSIVGSPPLPKIIYENE